MITTDLKSLEEQLHSEGFLRTYVWQDGPDAFYPDHTHPCEMAHIILGGEMTVTRNGMTQTYFTGDRCDVLVGEVHSAVMGSRGCRYMIGEKY